MSYRVIVKFDSVPHEHIDAPTGKVPQPLRLIDVYDWVVEDHDPVDRGLQVVLLKNAKRVFLVFLHLQIFVLRCLEQPRDAGLQLHVSLGVHGREIEEHRVEERTLFVPSEYMDACELHVTLYI